MVIESRGVENSELAVPVNNILVGHTAFLAADTQPCVLIVDQVYLNDADKNGHFTVLTWSHAIGHTIQCLKYGVITAQMWSDKDKVCTDKMQIYFIKTFLNKIVAS